ncbi:MAG: FAD-binding oxidoreductase [Dehalococcoidia bacterium]
MVATPSSTTFDDLRTSVSGPVLEPGQPGYDEFRLVHNGTVDCQPAAIVRCHTTADVVDAVNYGRAGGLELTIRGGGHNVAGRAVCDGGLMIDLAPMKGIFVDLKARTARAQGGVTWGELNRATQLHGLATTGGIISSTGVAGLTLGGGLGWLMGKYGLCVDNLRSAEVVTASGEVLQASASENPDLFWALRGGGGNFGVVTSFEFDLHEVGPMVTGGILAFPFDQAANVLRFYQAFTANLPDELTMFAGVLHAPDGSGAKICAVISCHCGSLEQAEADLRPLKGFGTPIMDALGPIPYSALNSMLDAGFPRGARNYWKSNLLSSLTAETIDVMIEQFAQCPSPMTGMLLEHFHGAVTRVPAEATAYAHRSEGYNLLVAAEWLEASEDSANIAWARQAFGALQPFFGAGGYVNYMGGDETEDRVASAYGANHARLRQVKRRYDPDNLFHMNQNILPA